MEWPLDASGPARQLIIGREEAQKTQKPAGPIMNRE
jgi:hypothetical protein